MPPFHFPNPGRGSGAEPPADGRPGVSPPEHFWDSICDLVHFDAVWWQLFVPVGRRTRYICKFAIKFEQICQLQCPHDCTTVLPLLSNEHALKSGTFGSRGWSCWDAEPHGTNPGHPGKSGTGGSPIANLTPDYRNQSVSHTPHTHTRLTALFPRLPM